MWEDGLLVVYIYRRRTVTEEEGGGREDLSRGNVKASDGARRSWETLESSLEIAVTVRVNSNEND